MAVGGKSGLHSAGDVAQSEMEAQRVLACVSTAKCAKCQNMRYTKYNKDDFFFFLVGLWWLIVVVPLLVSHIKGNEEKAIYSQLQSRLGFITADSSPSDQARPVPRDLNQAVIDNSSEYPDHMNLLASRSCTTPT